jgi:hypothetical protein
MRNEKDFLETYLEKVREVREDRAGLQILEVMIEDRLRRLKTMVYEESHPCVTPVDRNGDIIFNNNKQILTYDILNKTFQVFALYGDFDRNRNSSFEWVKVDRKDLKAGDTAYRTDFNHDKVDFTDIYYKCKILDEQEHVFVSVSGGVLVTNLPYKYWYKLVEVKEEQK